MIDHDMLLLKLLEDVSKRSRAQKGKRKRKYKKDGAAK